MLNRIKQHALTHYNEDGWDYLIECWTDEEIESFISNLTYEEAIVKLNDTLSTLDEYRQDVIAAGY
jgi:mannitol-1-phosphate/altronate dehydrogenase